MKIEKPKPEVDEEIDKVLCEADSFDQTNDCTNIAGSHTLSYVYSQDCETVRSGAGEARAFLCTIPICDDCFEFYQGPDDEMAFIDEIKWPCEYVLDYQEEVE